MEHVLTMANLKLKPSLSTSRPNGDGTLRTALMRGDSDHTHSNDDHTHGNGDHTRGDTDHTYCMM